MEELGFWSYKENIDELRQKLLFTTIELESLKVQATEEMRKHEEDVKHLIDLLKMAYKERDEAKDQLQKLLNKLMPFNSDELHIIVPQAQPESPLVIPMKANSSVTESNSGSSPVTSPDFSSINMADSTHINFVNKAYVQEYTGSLSTGLVTPSVSKIDPADAAIDILINGKVLPQKGKLLQAVTDAGPLLQTLVVGGSLPRWRNPPPLQQFKIPPFSIEDCETANTINQKQAANANSGAQKPQSLSSYLAMSRGYSRICSGSILNFTSGASGSGLGSCWPLNSGKRQKLL
ncbi:hypothetical protein GH714_034024 [Hevea brasiliensis]|uniref:Uncharacterized protein n=1 Tax=Hevea brasiliensis TaxID=3981 RepID=A0A6A6L6V1_HEVBR|nr:hypothetical protein GH714_034024 [Hevea brasiliensis]